jgi:hypothetical protein
MPDSDAAPASTVRGAARWRTAQVRDEMTRRYVQQHQTLRQIAFALGCSYGTVRVVLTTAEVQLRPQGGNHRHTRRTP